MPQYRYISQLFAQTVFIIPTFQRPYAWEEPQWNDLVDDLGVGALRRAASPAWIHYFGAIHTIPCQPDSPLLVDYVDPNNADIASLRDCNFEGIDGYQPVHLVVDGQQRLITLFKLLENYNPAAAARYVALTNGTTIPRLILNPADDHGHWRFLLGLDQQPPPKSQERLHHMSQYVADHAGNAGDPRHSFLTGPGAQVLLAPLPPGTTLAPFLTLNDRGKDLTRLEKVKSLAMEADQNVGAIQAVALNQHFGGIYRSIDQIGSLLDEDQFIRHLSIVLWEPQGDRFHDASMDRIYMQYRDQFHQDPGTQPNAVNNPANLVAQVIAKSELLIDAHNHLSTRLRNAINGVVIGVPSFANALFSNAPARDASDDYQMVLDSLLLQTKQLALLLAMRDRYQVDWHEAIGVLTLNNTDIRTALLADYAVYAVDVPEEPWMQTILHEIEAIPLESQRPVTPLYLAELLYLIVGDSAPGGYTALWQNYLGQPQTNAQDLVTSCRNYLAGFGRRYNFVVSVIARSEFLGNGSPHLKHLLREYECCLRGGLNAHRRREEHDIEHFFARAFNAIAAIPGHGFASEADYVQRFLDRPGNKLVLDSSLNLCLGHTPVCAKPPAYSAGHCGQVHVPFADMTRSALQIGHDVGNTQDLGLLRKYVYLRQLRLAAFAAQRF